MSSLDDIVNRDKGPQIPASIGSALALEGALGYPTPEGVPRLDPNDIAPIYQFDQIWFNLHTLIRNYLESMDREVLESAMDDDLLSGLMDDINVLEATVRNETRTRIRCVFYLSRYRGIARRFPKAKLKEARTNLQKQRQHYQDLLVKLFLEDTGGVDCRVFDYGLEGQDQKVLLCTHYPLDLLSKPKFAKLVLLESHTGKLKPQSQWGSKLTGKHTDQLPFNSLTLQLYGDGDMFMSLPLSFKEEIEKLANADRWTPSTTRDKIQHSIRRGIYDPRAQTLFLSML